MRHGKRTWELQCLLVGCPTPWPLFGPALATGKSFVEISCSQRVTSSFRLITVPLMQSLQQPNAELCQAWCMLIWAVLLKISWVRVGYWRHWRYFFSTTLEGGFAHVMSPVAFPAFSPSMKAKWPKCAGNGAQFRCDRIKTANGEFQKTQLQPPVGPSVALHPCPIFGTSATALCGNHTRSRVRERDHSSPVQYSYINWHFRILKWRYHIGPYFVGIFPYIGPIGLIGTSNLGSWNGHSQGGRSISYDPFFPRSQRDRQVPGPQCEAHQVCLLLYKPHEYYSVYSSYIYHKR